MRNRSEGKQAGKGEESMCNQDVKTEKATYTSTDFIGSIQTLKDVSIEEGTRCGQKKRTKYELSELQNNYKTPFQVKKMWDSSDTVFYNRYSADRRRSK